MLAYEAFTQAWAEEAFRVLKPGATLMAFGGCRTHHRLMAALEDAGFGIRDCMVWLFGSGFPKSLDISKAIDKAAGERRDREPRPQAGSNVRGVTYAQDQWTRDNFTSRLVDEPITLEAARWRGYGSALKPAAEFIVIAMKPPDGTFAHNAQKWGVAGLNVDRCRVQVEAGANLDGGRVSSNADGWDRPWKHDVAATAACRERGAAAVAKAERLGRWPANVLLDDEAAALLDEQSGELSNATSFSHGNSNGVTGWGGGREKTLYAGFADRGGASRFFYTAKVSTAEREGADHPTMKPIDLTRYLAKLILPPQRETPRRLLVPFAGVGSEMIGGILAGWDEVVGIEKDEGYAAKARERIVGTAPLFLVEGVT
jgi:site-specific DNA-methyltransferase (adenine-specific)